MDATATSGYAVNYDLDPRMSLRWTATRELWQQGAHHTAQQDAWMRTVQTYTRSTRSFTSHAESSTGNGLNHGGTCKEVVRNGEVLLSAADEIYICAEQRVESGCRYLISG